MEIIYLLLPIALILVIVMIWLFFWAVRSDQFEDMEGPAHRIIMEKDDDIPPPRATDDEADDARDKNA